MSETARKREIVEIAISEIIEADPPIRTFISEEKLAEMTKSVAAWGIQYPLKVRKAGEKYRIVDGFRRFQAALNLNMKTVPCEVLDLSDDKALALGFLTNYMHEDMNAQDEAELFYKLLNDYKWSIDDIAQWSGLSERTVKVRLSLLTLPEEVQALIRDEKLTPGLASELHPFLHPEIIQKRASKEECTEREAELHMRKDLGELAQQMVNEEWTKTSVRIRLRDYIRSLEPTHIPPPIDISAPKPQIPMIPCEVCGLSYPIEEVHMRRVCDKCTPKFNTLKQRGEWK